MEEVYDFLDSVFDIANTYFLFFYEKSIWSFKSLNPATDDEYNDFKGESKGLNGKEEDFKRKLHPIVKKYFKDEISLKVDCYINKIENIMLLTDKDGRSALARRIIKKVGKTTYIRARGFSELAHAPLDLLTDLQDDDIVELDREDSLKNYCLYIVLSTNSFYHFLIRFKELCKDFEIDFDREIDSYGFDSLKELTLVEWNKRIEPQDGKMTKKGLVNEFTKNKKRIAIEALLDAIGVEYGEQKAVSGASVHRFAHFLISEGNKEQPIDSTYTADVFKNKPTGVKTQKNDNSFVADYFLDLGLNEIATKIKEGRYN